MPALALAVWSAILFVPLSVGLEALRDSPEWRALSARSERATVWEMITLRHVPHLHQRSDS